MCTCESDLEKPVLFVKKNLDRKTVYRWFYDTRL